MLSKIKRKLRENENFYYLANLVRYWRKEEFKDFVRGFGGADTVLVEHLGTLYPEHLVYCIDNMGKGAGFFAELQRTLKYLYYADKFSLTPVVYWGNPSLYQEKIPVEGTMNVFEYYFQPISGITYEEIRDCKNVVFSFPRQVQAIADGNFSNGYREMESMRLRFAEIYQKYCKLNRKTQSYIELNLKKTFRRKKY